MSQQARNEKTYIEDLTRVSQEWAEWEEFGQIRRPSWQQFETRRSTPLCLLAALVLIGLAMEAWFIGLVVERTVYAYYLVGAAFVLFPIGRGVVVDGVTRTVTRWWGWVHYPLFRATHEFSDFTEVEVTKKLGPTVPDPTVGRDVTRPVTLVTRGGKKILLKTCSWVKGARVLAEEVAAILSVPVTLTHPEDEDHGS